MEHDADIAGGATWLAAANATWFVGGILAYFTQVSIAIVTALAMAPAVVGIMELRGRLAESRRIWCDRALSHAVGTWAVMGMLIVIPYVASGQGLSLWASRGFATLSLVAASAGMALWNIAAVHAVGNDGDIRAVRNYAAFHALALLIAAYFAATGDGGTTLLSLRGQSITAVDLQTAPAVAAVPGLLWGITYWRVRTATAPGPATL